MSGLTHADNMALRQAPFLSEDERRDFRRLLANGSSPAAALMFASRRAPGVKGTDRAFTERANRRMGAMGDRNLNSMLAVARRAGINTQGKYYCGQLGKYDDPRAWVSGADDVLSTARAKNMTIEGAVSHKGVEEPVEKATPGLAPDIVADIARDYCRKDEALAAKVRTSTKAANELREMVVAKHGKKGRKGK